MKKPTTKSVAIAFGMLVILMACVVVVLLGRPRVLAQRSNPDGTSALIVGKPRLLGLLGIEIVLEYHAKEGTKTYGSVQDLLGSWKEAIVKYENPEGGGLLIPLPHEYGG